MRYRLQWQAIPAEEGAPPGLDVARERLLLTSSDLWSPEDRRVVGAMLQRQIEAERGVYETCRRTPEACPSRHVLAWQEMTARGFFLSNTPSGSLA